MELDRVVVNKDDLFWKNYRKDLTKLLEEKIEISKTEENIVKMAIKSGIKPTARYFDISPSQVRYYIKKGNKDIKN